MNKTLVISGASRGIGAAIARHFAKHGFDIAFCSKNEKNVQQFETELREYGNKVHGFVCDCSKKEQVLQFADFVVEKLQHCNILINNAGVFLPGKISEEAEGAFEMQINTNLASAYYLTRKLLPTIEKAEKRHIVNICSIASIAAYAAGGSYTISKFALLGLSKSLRAELLTKNIAVTAVLPGATLTDSWAGVDLPKERFMQPEDVAKSIWTAWELNPTTVMEEILLRPMLGDI